MYCSSGFTDDVIFSMVARVAASRYMNGLTLLVARALVTKLEPTHFYQYFRQNSRDFAPLVPFSLLNYNNERYNYVMQLL